VTRFTTALELERDRAGPDPHQAVLRECSPETATDCPQMRWNCPIRARFPRLTRLSPAL